MSFMDCFQWFLTMYAHADEDDREKKKATMNMEWHIDDDFPKLARTINAAILQAQFESAPITDQDAYQYRHENDHEHWCFQTPV